MPEPSVSLAVFPVDEAKQEQLRLQLQMMQMGSVLSAPLKNIWQNRFKELSSDFLPGQQEDAHEFLRCLLENLHKCTLDPKSKGKPSSIDEESIVKQVFGGRMINHLTCRDCGHCSETFEPFLDLSLEIDQVDDLAAALESFTKVEQIGDAKNKITCGSCNGQVCKDKQLLLDKAPDVLAFQLKRFAILDGSIEKIGKHVVYPSELDLKPFHSNPDKEDLKYDLYGVVKHSGLPSFGHYVDSITETSALHQEAYMLFYVRQSTFPWFSSLLEEADSGASPMSVVDNKDVVMRCAPSATEITNPERPSTPAPHPKRMYSIYDHNVFAFENLDENEHETKVKKSKATSASKYLKSSTLDQNASRLMRSMTSARRKCFLNRLDSHNVVLC
ncbi:ubiquitin carboxyl-terminal hydrolase 21-like [Lolium perenne]|uniref:ubiquitin carboxyl-terminal hydrolase 21-like n=1 Tax=Lolium perenne TaxID=4522 RepID=UPI0021F5C517|nr:ubiquitin carboxyl-terminal hydrolase 21-like [Lolium perenne]